MGRVQRRQFLIATGALVVAPRQTVAQNAGRLRRIGLLYASTKEGVATEMEAVIERLRELGHVPGKNLQVVARFAGGVPARLPDLARELVDEGVEVVFVPNAQGALALQRLSERIAIVFIAGDPVGSGLVNSLARPGRNATGFTLGAITIVGKRVQQLKEAFPSIKKIGVLVDLASGTQKELDLVIEASRKLGMRVQHSEPSSRDQYLDAVVRLRDAGVDAYYVAYTASSFAIRRDLAAAIRNTRRPAIYSNSRFCDDGGLMAYSYQQLKVAVLAAEYIDRILRGTSPAELPVQEPTLIEFVVNLATAREQGISVPQAILVRADRVIE